MKQSHIAELLGRLSSELERLEAQHAAAVARSRELSEENAGLRSKLSDGSLCPPFAGALRPAVAFADDGRPSTTASSAAKRAFAAADAGKFSRAIEVANAVEELPALCVPLPGAWTPSARGSPPLSVTSTPHVSPRLENARAASPRPEPIKTPALPAREPVVLHPKLEEPADDACDPSVVNTPKVWSSVHASGSVRAGKMSMWSWGGKRFTRGSVGIERPTVQSMQGKSKRLVGAIGQFAARSTDTESTPKLERAKSFNFLNTSKNLSNVVNSSWFDGGFSLLIFLNAVIMALEAQYKGFDYGISAGYPGCTIPAAEQWPGAEDVFKVMNLIFGILFTIELVIKVAALRVDFLRSIWNWFDTFAVSVWLIEEIVSSVVVSASIVRLGRMARLARLARMVKTIQAFDSLQVLLGSIQASASALFWSSCLLLLIQMIVGLAIHNLLQDHMSDPAVSAQSRKAVYGYFGSFSRSMISMFELSMANWPQICWTLVNGVSEWYGIVVLLYKLVVGFAVLVVVTGVFLHETFKVASSDDDLMLVQKQRATKNHVAKMERLFREADTSNDGLIDRDEFKKVLNIDKVRTWLSAMELEVSDPDLLFDFLDDGDENITVAELIDGVARLKGAARNIDVVALMHNVNKLYDLVEDVQEQIMRRTDHDRRTDHARQPVKHTLYEGSDRDEFNGQSIRTSKQ